jgi:hypothetical protein
MGRDETTAVFCITEESAEQHAAADPDHTAAVRRMDARRSYLGLEAQLGGVSAQMVSDLTKEAWAAQAPKSLVKQHAEAL